MREVSWSAVSSQLASAKTDLVIASFVSYYLSYAVRSVRWIKMLKGIEVRINFGRSLALILSSYALNCIVPAKAGDIYRALLARNSKTAGFFSILGTVAAERVADLLCVLFAFVLGTAMLFAFPADAEGLTDISSKLFASVGAALVIVLAVVVVIANIDRVLKVLVPAKYQAGIAGIKTGFFGALSRPLQVATFTLAVWALELGCFAIALGALSIPSGAGEALFTASASTMSNAVPFTPGGLGAYELAAREILVAVGRNPGSVIAAIIIIRLINYWSLIAIGAVAGLFTGLSSRNR